MKNQDSYARGLVRGLELSLKIVRTCKDDWKRSNDEIHRHIMNLIKDEPIVLSK